MKLQRYFGVVPWQLLGFSELLSELYFLNCVQWEWRFKTPAVWQGVEHLFYAEHSGFFFSELKNVQLWVKQHSTLLLFSQLFQSQSRRGGLTARHFLLARNALVDTWLMWGESLTLVSPAVMFCRAPAAASRVVELISQRCSTWLYSSTILGCQSHSMSLGCRDTSVNVVRSWFCLWKKRHNMRWSWSLKMKTVIGIWKQLLTSLAFLLLGVKQPIASPFEELWARLGPSSRIRDDGVISVYSWKDRFLNTHTAFSTPWERNTLMNGHVNTHLVGGGNNRGRI